MFAEIWTEVKSSLSYVLNRQGASKNAIGREVFGRYQTARHLMGSLGNYAPMKKHSTLVEMEDDMFGHMKVRPILTAKSGCSVEEAVQNLVTATEAAQPVRWIEFPAAILLCVTVANDPDSGAFYVLDRRHGVWLWIDFEDEAFGGYSVNDFDRLVHEYDILSLVERPALLMAGSGWVLEAGKPAEMSANA